MSIKNKIIKLFGGYTFEDIVGVQKAVDRYRNSVEQFEQQLKEADKRIIEPVSACMDVPFETAKILNDEQIKKLYTPLLVEKILAELMYKKRIDFIYKKCEEKGSEPYYTASAKLYIARKIKEDE